MSVGRQVWHDLCRLGTRRQYAAGRHIIRRDGRDSSVVAVVSGLCKVVDSIGDGHDTLVAVRGPGEIIGELAALTGADRSASVIALVAVDATLVARADFDVWLLEPDNARRLAVMLAEKLSESSRPQVGAHHRVEARLADRILYLDHRFNNSTTPGPSDITVPLTHDDYASWIGATRAVTTRAMGSLRDRGLIDHGRGWIRIIDRQGLAQLSMFGT